jgi:hypothetical protein
MIPDTVAGFINWSARPVRVEAPDGPSTREDAPTLTGGLWTIVPRFPGEILTADKYNVDRQVMVDNAVPAMIDDHSATLAQMQATTDPAPGGAPALATSLAGELERIRYVLGSLSTAATYWYDVPRVGLQPANGYRLPNSMLLQAERADGVYEGILGMGNDDKVYLGSGITALRQVILGRADGAAQVPGDLYVEKLLSLNKGQWIQWDEVQGVSVGGDNKVYVGSNAAGITLGAAQTLLGGTTIAGVCALMDTTTLAPNKWLTGGTGGALQLIAGSTDGNVYIGGTGTTVNVQDPLVTTDSITANGNIWAVSTAAVPNKMGNGDIHGISTARAWGRYMPDVPVLYQWNIESAVTLGPGSYRFRLTLPLATLVVIATPEPIGTVYDLHAEVVYESAQQFLIIVRDHAGVQVAGRVNVVVYGQLPVL